MLRHWLQWRHCSMQPLVVLICRLPICGVRLVSADWLRDVRLQLLLSQEEMLALDDWRFSRRMPSRAAAVRELLRRALAAEGVALPPLR